jgi:hypothetical protein
MVLPWANHFGMLGLQPQIASKYFILKGLRPNISLQRG